MNSKQRRKGLRLYGRVYDRVRVDYGNELKQIMENLERYPKSMVMVQIQGMIEKSEIPFKDALSMLKG